MEIQTGGILKARSVFYVLVIGLFGSCIEPYTVVAPEGVSLLHIKGYITTTPGTHTIRLTRTATYGSVFVDFIRKVPLATVGIRNIQQAWSPSSRKLRLESTRHPKTSQYKSGIPTRLESAQSKAQSMFRYDRRHGLCLTLIHLPIKCWSYQKKIGSCPDRVCSLLHISKTPRISGTSTIGGCQTPFLGC